MKTPMKNHFLKICVFIVSMMMSLMAYGQNGEFWASQMFTIMGTARSHDFGSVALHSVAEHRFPFKNISKSNVVISSVNSSCGCTKASTTTKVVKPGEVGEIIARVDTSGKEHTKDRKATITIQFTEPQRAEIQLQITTYIRSDIGFEPGVVEFGTVNSGSEIVKKIHLQYEGSSNWALTSIQKTNSSVKAEAKEISRRGGRVTYEVSVYLLKNASAGYLNGLLRFTGNEPNAEKTSVFLPLHGLIMEPLTAKPSNFQLGVVYSGEEVTKNVVVRGATPFRIVRISSPDSRLKFSIADQESAVHVIPVTFTAGSGSGTISNSISILTSQPDSAELEISVTGVIAMKSSFQSVKKNVLHKPTQPVFLEIPTDPDIGTEKVVKMVSPLQSLQKSPLLAEIETKPPQLVNDSENTPPVANSWTSGNETAVQSVPGPQVAQLPATDTTVNAGGIIFRTPTRK